jgi:hypothetical protein
MTKEELIQNWEKEIEDFKKAIDDTHTLDDYIDYARCNINAISGCLEELKQLNATTTRIQIIDFLNYLNKDCGHKFFNLEQIADDYLK